MRLSLDILARVDNGPMSPDEENYKWLEQYGFRYDDESTWMKLAFRKDDSDYEVFYTDKGNWLIWERRNSYYEWDHITCIKSETKFDAYLFLLGNKFITLQDGDYE